MKKPSHEHGLPPELREMVRRAVALFGEVVRRELGAAKYRRIEAIRRRMAGLRGLSSEATHRRLEATYRELEALSPRDRLDVAHAYSLMLELMNSCENAYRTYRLREKPRRRYRRAPEAVVFVLTAHPTEARSPAVIAAFHEVREALVRAFEGETGAQGGFEREEPALRNLYEVLWRLHVMRSHKPSVRDEAEHLYHLLLREDTLRALLQASRELAPVYARSWVGSDKDGHPGVNEKTLHESFQASRALLHGFAERRLAEVHATLAVVNLSGLAALSRARVALRPLKRVRAGDGARSREFRLAVSALHEAYLRELGARHPALDELKGALHLFPALVVPLELRESSDLVMAAAAGRPGAITRMVRKLAALARGGDPKAYVRGFVISMASRFEHVEAACHVLRRELGGLKVPVIPLFEQREALARSSAIVAEMLRDARVRRAVRVEWGGLLEVMVGYSDSAKEVGVLASRVELARAMWGLDATCRRAGVRPVFFQGSGGSVDRGGGSVQEQTAWWPASALRYYKVTLQGEMVERSLASPEIARGQIERICQCAEAALGGRGAASRAQVPEAARAFAGAVREAYCAAIASPGFLRVVEAATPYPYLSALKIGSRPSKRGGKLTVGALRAIPWVLCWTQTRVLFPTWWGVGTAWRSRTAAERRALVRAVESSDLLRSYVKLLGFTLAKVELPVWRLYLEHSSLEAGAARAALERFEAELDGARAFVRALSGSGDLLWFRPWLGESIRLRAPMIHPLNALQVLAFRGRDAALIRETVTGIASGMMTTG